jgi:hypothetical protein
MKKIFTALMLTCIGTATFAQAPVKDISGNLTGTINWVKDTIYLLKGKVYVKAGGVLNIAPGTIIKGDKATPGSALIITRGAQIKAVGTPNQPIVFTSSAAPADRDRGDWAGVAIAGNAKANMNGGIGTFEGGNLANPDGTIADGQYGGLNDLDNSGELKYVRIEYAGFAFATNNELNSLTLGGVGSGTKISYVQCSYGLDDAFEFFGGTVNASHLVAFRGNDDDFDTDFGYSGKIQFGVSFRDTAVADGVSGANAFESDNDGASSGNNPYTSCVFSNMTLVGPKFNANTVADVNFRNGAHIRKNSRMSLFNSIVMGWPNGLKIDGDSCHDAADNGNLVIKNTVLAGCTKQLDSTSGAVWNITPWFNTMSNANSILANTSDVQLTSPFNYNAPDFRPAAASPMLSGASFTDAKLATGFTTVNYRGAFGTDDWTLGWTNFQPDTMAYTEGYNPLSVNDLLANKLSVSVYPNPAQNEIYIASNENLQDLSASLYTLDGRLVTASVRKISNNQSMIEVSRLTNGIYLLHITSGIKSSIEKIVINK